MAGAVIHPGRIQGEDYKAAERVAQRLLGRDAGLERISGRGSCNSVFTAAADGEKVVIRVNANRDHREFAKEGWCMKQAAMAGVDVPRPLGHGVQDGWNYGVQSFEGDRNGAERGDAAAVWRWLGASAAKLHKVPVEGFGEVLTDEKTGLFGGNWQAYLQDNIRALSDGGGGCAHPSGEQAIRLRQRFEDLARQRFDFGLCHGDLVPRNVVLDRAGRATLVDWGCAEAHVVPHFEFRELLRNHPADGAEARAFMAGYGLDGWPAALVQEVESLLLLCSFDVLRWAKDRAPTRVAEKEERFRAFLDRFEPS